MKTRFIGAASLFIISSLCAIGASAQAAQVSPGNCAVWAEMAAQTVGKDKRFASHPTIAPALSTYAKAQRGIMQAGMAKTYADAKAFGWDKATVDAKIKDGEDALRAGFFTPTMKKDRLYMDHVMAVYNCANGAKSAAELGQSPNDMKSVFETLVTVVRQP